MQKKSLFSAIITVLLGSILFGYSLVFGATSNYSGPIRIEYNSGLNIYSDDINLNKTKLLFRSGVDLTETKIISTCETHTKFISKQGDLYLLELKYFPNCSDGNISINDIEGQKIFSGKMNVFSESTLWSKFIDYSPEDIQMVQTFLSNKLVLQYKNNINADTLEQYKKDRVLDELHYFQSFILNIQKKRLEKYLVPVEGYEISTNPSRIPNSARPYRETYTDGIHHGWDVGSQLGEAIRALDDAVVVRVVSGFEYSDISKIDETGEMTVEKEVKNLDILRGNQVWLKTAKGDVVFYSHLSGIYSQIKEGVIVRKGELIGTIGKTGVPGTDYSDYHLHFAIQKNPYDKEKYGKYTYEDYMEWDWYFKGQSSAEVLKYQEEVFE